MNTIQQEPGAHQTPHLFRRPTGAHAILVKVLGADLAEMLLLLLLGGFAGPPLTWLARALFFWLHTSLIGDIALVMVLALCAYGLLTKLLGRAKNADSWGCLAMSIPAIAAVFALLWLIKPDWIAIHASAIPVGAREAFPWPLTFVASDAWTALALFLLAHLLVWRGYQQAKTTRNHTFSRAHQDGDVWGTIEAAYAICQRELARYDPPPFILKTPPTFLYYIPDADKENEERLLYWSQNDLILPINLISTDQAKAEILLPYLGRLLSDYQSPEIPQVEVLFDCLRLARKHAYTRFFLGLTVLLARSCEDQWHASEPERVLDRDRFAFWLGQGKRLRKQLKNRLDLLNAQGLPDNTIPTLMERIDHIGSLIRKEARQLKQLRETVPSVGQPPSAPTAERRETEDKRE